MNGLLGDVLTFVVGAALLLLTGVTVVAILRGLPNWGRGGHQAGCVLLLVLFVIWLVLGARFGPQPDTRSGRAGADPGEGGGVMGIRYTTQAREPWDPAGIVLRLLRQPALWVAFLTLSAGPTLGWSQPLTLTAAAVFTLVTTILTLHSSRWSVAARLRRAIAESGLAARDARGRVLLPRARRGPCGSAGTSPCAGGCLRE